MTTWDELVAVLGADVVRAAPGAHRVERLVVEPDPGEIGGGDVVLAVGRDGRRAFRSLLGARPPGGTTGLVLRSGEPGAERLLETAVERGVPFIALGERTDWISVIERAQRLLGPGPRPDAQWDAQWDLFELAAAAAAIVDGPVSIEDSAGRVVGYGGDHATADAARVAAVLRREVPRDVAQALAAARVPARLAATRDALYLDDVPGLAPRVAVAVRSGGEVVGTAWAIVGGPPQPDVLAEFARCAGLAALHLVRAAQPPSPPSRLDNEGFAALLYGGAGAAEAAGVLQLPTTGAAVMVLAVRGAAFAESARLRARVQARLIAAGGRGVTEAHVGDLNNLLFVVVPAASFADSAAVVRWFDAEVAPRLDPPAGARIVAGVGQVRAPAELPQSRHEAELALTVADERGATGAAAYDEVWARSFLRRLGDLALANELDTAGPVPVLAAHDGQHGTEYLTTLRAHLLTGGDARRAAALLHVHPNTYRYRMRRIEELVPVPLDRLDVHAAIAVQLALRAGASGSGR